MEPDLLNLFEGVSISRPPEQVVAQIRKLIAKGLLKPGDMLPPERSLSERLGISRGHVREGIKTLELYGIVKSIQGRGTVVTDLGIQSMSGLLGNLLKITADDIMALMDARILIESHTAKLAASNGSAEDKETMHAILAEMQYVGDDTDRWLETDLRLHIAIAQASHNPVLVELVKFMTPNLVGYYRKFLRNQIVIAVQVHKEIVEYIAAGKAVKAGKLMHTHLMEARKPFEALATGAAARRRRRKKAGD